MPSLDLRSDFLSRLEDPTTIGFADFDGNEYTFEQAFAYFVHHTSGISRSAASIGLICSDSLECHIFSFFLTTSSVDVYFLPADWLTNEIWSSNGVTFDNLIVFDKGKVSSAQKTCNSSAQVITACSLPEFHASYPSFSLCDHDHNWIHSQSSTCIVFFSSGSTGTPKAIQLSYDNINSCYSSVALGFLADITYSEIISLHNASFVISIPFLFAFSLDKNSVLVARSGHEKSSSVFHFLRHLSHFKSPLLITVPSLLRNILSLSVARQNMSTLSIISCGEPLTIDLALKLVACDVANFYNLYGSTEVSPWILYLNVLDYLSVSPRCVDTIILPAGEPLPSVKVYLDPKNSELLVSCSSVFSGYASDDNNKDIFVDIGGHRYFRTGDAFHFSSPYYFCNGRLNSAVKLAGTFVNPVLLEAMVRSTYPDVNILLLPDSETSVLSLLIFSQSQEAPAQLISDIIDLLRTRIHPSVPIAPFTYDSEPQYLPSGKIDRGHYTKLLESQ